MNVQLGSVHNEFIKHETTQLDVFIVAVQFFFVSWNCMINGHCQNVHMHLALIAM